MPFNILLVDDDRDFREEFRECLDEYNVVEASNGREALEILTKPNEIDLVILDVVMPGMRGTDVLKALKEAEPDLGVVILTGYGSKSVVVEALKGRADDYLEKPLDIPKAKEVIARLLRARPVPEGASADGIEARIRRVTHFLERNYDKAVSLRDVAAIACLSPKYLSRVFPRIVGQGFNAYKSKVKAERAARLLVTTDTPIEQIAFDLAYENPESFARAFKKTTGVTPSAYRAGARSQPGEARHVRRRRRGPKKTGRRAGSKR